MKRRDFLKQSAAGVAAFSVMGPGFIPSAEAQAKTKVALVKTLNRTKGVSEAIKLIDFASPKGKKVLLKPNFNTADPTPGSTHNDTLRQLVVEMKARSAAKITVGERSFPATKSVLEAKGIPAMAQELGFDVINFEELSPEGWAHFNPPDCHWQNGFDVARPVVEAEYLLWTCCLKTHGAGGIHSMSLKLAVGSTNKSLMRELHGARQTHMRRMIAEIHQAFKPQLIVMDGVDVFVDGGPSTGKLVTAGVFVAGTDRIAVDAVGLAILKELGSNTAIMSTKIFEQEQLQRAAELGLGVNKPDLIEIVTPDAESRAYADKLRAILDQG